MREKVSSERAYEIFITSGLTPLEEFPGTRHRWKCECQSCGAVVTPFYSSVANNRNNGCKFCAREQAKATKKLTDVRKALALLGSKDLDLISEYVNVKSPALLKCRTCGKSIYAAIDSFRGQRVCSCKRTKKLPEMPLSKSHPDLVKEWNKSLNEESPETVSKGSRYLAWWNCSKSHVYDSFVYSRVAGRGCPFCSGRRVLSGESDFASRNPSLVKEWHFEKNGEIFPDQIAAYSNTKFWWVCSKDSSHEWEATPGKRSSGRGCPFCARLKFKSGVNDIATLRPDWATEWIKEKNRGMNPKDVAVFSKERFWWRGVCGHDWDQSPSQRSRGFGCTVCAGKKVVPGINDLASEHPEIAMYLDVSANDFLATEVTSQSGKAATWFCDFGHRYESIIANKVRLNSGCPVCSLKVVQVGSNDLASSDPDLMKLWNWELNSEIDPKSVTSSSRESVWWLCKTGHPTYRATIRSRKLFGCPYCSGRFVLKGETDLATVNPALAHEWDPELNQKGPSEVSSGSDYMAWWKDDKGHSWQQRVQVRSKGVGCPECSEGGFSSTKPGLLYLIYNEKLLSRKVGITNLGIKTDRLAAFEAEGWVVERLWSGSGGQVLRLETVFFRWLRREKGIPPYLTYFDMKRTGGWSETFSAEFENEKVLAKQILNLITSEELELTTYKSR